MLCSNCSSKDASFHYKYIKNGAVTEIHLCQDCAKELGYIKENEPIFSPASFLGELLSIPHPAYTQKVAAACPNCKTPFETIRRTGYVGCDKCYEAFAKPIDAILAKIQPSTVHKGKLNGVEGKKIERDNTLKGLKEELNRAILDENYEQAAVIRDKIRAIENEEGNQNG